jgi:AcrR family transcriptional regulator
MNDTREFIIDQAHGLFLNRSYEAVSINDISKAIGFTKGALYHHFRNKEDLFKAVIDKYLKIYGLTSVNMNISLAEHIRQVVEHSKLLVKNIFAENQPFVPVNYLSLFIDAFRHYPDFFNEKKQLFQTEIEHIKIIMDNAIKTGEIRQDIDTSVMAMNFFSITLGIAANIFRNETPESAANLFTLQMNALYDVLKK